MNTNTTTNTNINPIKSNIRNEQINTLNELIAVTRDGAEFYGDAAAKAKSPQLQTLFRHMADSKNGLVGAMSREVKSVGGSPEATGTFRGTLHQLYGDARGKLGSTDYGYVAELEASEDRLLCAFDNVLKDDDVAPQVKEAVRGFLPKVREQHQVMRDRKWAMEATKH
ncbi:MAG: PA2169 family four-helix-bundle protein [Luteimonas sp.]